MRTFITTSTDYNFNPVGDPTVRDEQGIRDLANYYLEYEDMEHNRDFNREPLANAIKFVARFDKVEETDRDVAQDSQEFLEHLEKSVKELHEVMDSNETGDYEERFDLTLSMNGKEISMPMHADLYHRLIDFVKSEIEENKL